MIVGVGIDVVDITHFKRVLSKGGDSFVKKVFSKSEQKEALKLKQNVQLKYFAKRYAAKEAFVKALGTGFGPINIQDVWVEKLPQGQPVLKLSTNAQKYVKRKLKHPFQTHLSLSDDKTAVAIVILEQI